MTGNNGGPWGGGGGNRGGSGGGDDQNRGGRRPGNEGPQIPEIDELVNKGREQLRVLMGGGGGRRQNGGAQGGGEAAGSPDAEAALDRAARIGGELKRLFALHNRVWELARAGAAAGTELGSGRAQASASRNRREARMAPA